jgi:hypothetical protein
MTEIVTLSASTLKQADEGSYFTVIGAGGDLQEWVTGVTGLLTERKIGTPSSWFTASGAEVNEYARKGRPGSLADPFPNDLTFLMFSLDGLAVGSLAIFKLQFGARWFDDIIDNMEMI